MKWLYRLEYKHKNWGFRNLMLTLVAAQAMVYIADVLLPTVGIASMFAFSWPAIMHGQVWRLITFLFVPPALGIGSILSVAITLYLYYFIGAQLENTWGTFRFNAYYWMGALGAMLAGVLSALAFGSTAATSYYLNLSLFLAFATLYPEVQLLLMFIIPIKVKYLGYAAAAYLAFLFVVGSWPARVSIALSLINYFLFFGGSFISKIRQRLRYHKAQQNWNRH